MRRVSAKKIPQTQRCPRDLFYSRQTAFKRQLNSCQTAAKQIGENPQKCTFRFSKLYFSFCRLYINFESEELNEIFLNEVILSFEDPIYFSEGTYEHLDIKNEDLDYLNKMKIYKSNTIDILKLPTDGYIPCVDVNNRFNNGDLIKTELAWIFEKHIHSRLSVVIII